MGYQAVLFCPDEKLTRVVSQVFGEVDFVVEPVNDPFTVVKKLMAQHYDAIVVDCENEQSSSLLFKSAHNSPFNQHSLAIALVEGQDGVARAYRIGANLVLTKPINVEQAKGTLRVARGLLRKSADAAAAASTVMGMPAKEAHGPADLSSGLMSDNHTAAGPPSHDAAPTFASPFSTVLASTPPLPAMSAWGEAQELPAAAMPSAQIEARVPAARTAQAEKSCSQGMTGDRVAKTESPNPAEVSVPVQAAAALQSAAAPAPAKEAFKPAEMKPAKKEAALDMPADPKEVESVGPEESISYKGSVLDGLSFAAFQERDADGSGGSKKILIVTAAFLALAAAVYFGWSTFGGSHSGATPHPATSGPQHQPVEPQADLALMSPSTPDHSSPSKINRQSASASPLAVTTAASQTGKPLPSASSSVSSSEHIALSPEPAAKEPEQEPIRVRPDALTGKAQAQPEATVQPPNPLAVELPARANLKGIVDSETNVSKPTLAQIKVSQGVSQGLLIKGVQPKYPAEARASHAQGIVQIEATIDKEGNVVRPKVLSGNAVLAKAALDAVRQWRYKPYYLNGDPVEIQTQITINFKGN